MKRVLRFLFCFMLICTMPLVISADSGYSTEDDPLITKSYIEQVLMPQLKKEILAELEVEDLTESVKAELKKQLLSELTKELTNSLTASIKKDLTDKLTKELTASLSESISKELRDKLTEEIREEVEDGLTESISAELTERLTAELTPVITESVRADLIVSLTAEIGAKLEAEMFIKLDAAISQILAERLFSGEFEEIRLQPGYMLMALGPIEMVMTSGIAKATLPDGFSAGVGVYDLSEGRRLLPGEEILQGHSILISGTDGVGLVVTNTEAIIMIRGEYSIVNQAE